MSPGDDGPQGGLTVPFSEDEYLKLVEHLRISPRMAVAMEHPVPRVETWKETDGTLHEGM